MQIEKGEITIKARIIASQPETAVLYHLEAETEEGAAIRALLSQRQIEARELPEASLGQSVAAFLESPQPQPVKETPYEGAVILFSGVEPKKQQETLRAMRSAGLALGAIKAVVTPTNRSWTFERLFAELSAEHAAMAAAKTAGHKGTVKNG